MELGLIKDKNMATPQEQLEDTKQGTEVGQKPDALDALTTALTQQAQKSVDIVSSEPTALEAKTGEIKKGLEEAQLARETGIEAGAERQTIDIKKVGEERLTTARELSRGLGSASSFALIDRIEKSTEASLRDLDLRKKEALATGSMETASKIAELELTTIKNREEQKQQMFNNLISLYNVQTGRQQEERLKTSQTFSQQQAVSAVALKYGLEVKEGDTIDTITARAMPFASQEQRLQIEKEKADIKRIEAETTKALRGDEFGADEDVVESISQTLAILDPESTEYETLISGLDKKPAVLAKIFRRVAEINSQPYTENDLQKKATNELNNNVSFRNALSKIASDSRVSDKARAEEILREIYNKPATKDSGSVFTPKALNRPGIQVIKEKIQEAKETSASISKRQETLKKILEEKGLITKQHKFDPPSHILGLQSKEQRDAINTEIEKRLAQ